MIANLISFFLFLLISFNFASSHNCSQKLSYNKYENSLVELNLRNFVTIRGPIQSDTVADFTNKISKIDSDDIYIYISSPGGSVMEGLKIVDIIKSTEKSGVKIKCISDFAASMAFIILQSCPIRLASPSSVLMQHQMSLSLKGDIKNVGNYLSFIQDIDNELDLLQSEKIGLTIKDFRSRIENDWWINGASAVDKKVVDKLVNMKCHKELDNKFEYMLLNFGYRQIQLIYSKCPFSRYPVQVMYLKNGFFKEIDVKRLINEDKELVNELKKWINYEDPIFELSY